jgi:hypothetical protein
MGIIGLIAEEASGNGGDRFSLVKNLNEAVDKVRKADHRITTGPSEGFNSRIQSIKSASIGFRNFEGYQSRILLFCGKLDLLPNSNHQIVRRTIQESKNFTVKI